jgi:hypothetical protein
VKQITLAILITPFIPTSLPAQTTPKVLAPPAAFFDRFKANDREAARAFYKKHIDAKGLSIAAGGDVADEALEHTYHIVTHMLAGRPDILAAMQKFGTRLIIIGKDQVYTDMPEYRNHPNPVYQNERVRGTGGLGVTSFGEENLLNLAIDRYDDESIAVHEFCHTIDAALRTIDKGWSKRLGDTFQKAKAKGLWKDAYAGSNQAEYWAEIAQSYLDCNRVNNWNHNSIGSREQLKLYDPEGYELCRTTFNFSPDNDWRYKPVRVQPSVMAPPAKFKVDPYYSKFTYAREFVVLGSGKVSDKALLKANDTIRKMFAYRHDVLKAMIADGVRLVVLGQNERLGDLPEMREAARKAGNDNSRFLDYAPNTKLLVVPEENVLRQPDDGFAGKSMVVAVFAKGFYRVCGTRPAQQSFGKGPKQQYELRVKRLDIEFDNQVAKLHEAARAAKLWRGTPADRDRIEYWCAGVEAYFDAAGAGFPPLGADRPITTREALKSHDPGLFALVDETMAYKERVDWRMGK